MSKKDTMVVGVQEEELVQVQGKICCPKIGWSTAYRSDGFANNMNCVGTDKGQVLEDTL